MKNSQVPRVLVVSEDALTRAGLVAHLSKLRGYRVCGEAASARSARELRAKLRPSCAVLELPLLHGGGLSLAREFARGKPKVFTVALVRERRPETLHSVLQAGAHGVVWREEAAAALGPALDKVCAGGLYASPEVDTAILAAHQRGPQRAREGKMASLSQRELEVLEAIGHGRGPTAIAAELGRAVKTVETHMKRIREKLGLASTADLKRVAKCWAAG